jgi:hypothetical protein
MNDTKRSSRQAAQQQPLFHPITSIVFAKRVAVLVQEMDRSIDRACVTLWRFYNCTYHASVISNDTKVRNDRLEEMYKYSSAASKF